MIRPARLDDLVQIHEIYNEVIAASTAVAIDEPVVLEERLAWWRRQNRQGFPILVAVEGEQVFGFASFGEFRSWESCSYAVDHSVYVRADRRREGVGRLLVEALVALARGGGKHVMIAGIEASNEASLALHEKLGFRRTGRFQNVGRKLGRVLDFVEMELRLSR